MSHCVCVCVCVGVCVCVCVCLKSSTPQALEPLVSMHRSALVTSVRLRAVRKVLLQCAAGWPRTACRACLVCPTRLRLE